VALLGAARVHVAGLRALEPKGRACDTVLGLRDRTERAVRLEWIDLLGELGDGRASKDLEGLYEGADSAVRGRVIDALLSIGNGVVPWARAALDRQLGRGPELDVDVTGKLVNLLGRRGGSADVAILARVLRDVTDRTPEDVESPKIRRFAAEALGTAGVKRNSTAAIQALIETGLRDPSSGVRQKSAAALADATGSPAALAGLEGLLRDDDKDTAREAAAESLLTLLGAEAGPRLAPHVGQDEKLMEILDRAVKKALAETKIIALRETVENLISVDPDRTVGFLFSVYVMFVIKTYIRAEDGSPRRMFEQGLDLILNGLLRPEGGT